MTDRFAAKAAEWDTPSPRTAMAEKFVQEIKGLNIVSDSSHVVEFGCGTGLVGINFVENAKKVTFVDNSPAMLSVLKEKISFLNSTNCEIIEGSYPEMSAIEKSDLFIALMSVHHVESIEEMAKAFHSSLKPGGKVIVGDLRTEDGSFHGAELVPHNGFDEKELSKTFVDAGFVIEKFYTFNTMHRTLSDGSEKDFDQFIMIAKSL